MTLMRGIQTALKAVYPARCLTCGSVVDSDFGLCGPCWRDTAFIGGTICDACGVPLPGEMGGDDLQCDACLQTPRPWSRGRAAMLYRDTGRKLVLALKHGDRQEIAHPASLWMAEAVRNIVTPETIIAPIPLHWRRMIARRYNQSALLARALGTQLDVATCLDLLHRPKRTDSLDGKGRVERFDVLNGAITLNPKHAEMVAGKTILLVDDVMTSGATLAAATHALQAGNAKTVHTVVLARVAKDT